MKIVDVKQGSPEWLKARLGIPTASEFSRIVTPKELKPSKSAEKYLWLKLAERILGHPVDDDDADTGFMLRGTDLERSAVSAYELARDTDTTEVGFVLHDSGQYGCSPDRLVGEDGGLEIKCLAAHNHLAALVNQTIDPKHYLQVQGNLLVTGLKWWDILFFNPAFPYAIIRIEPHAASLSALGLGVATFCLELDKATKKYHEEYDDTVAVTPEPKKEKKAKPAKEEKAEPWDETPVNTKSAAETKAAAAKPAAPKAVDAPDPKREFFGALKNWVGPDGEPIVSTKSAANMRTLVSGLLKRSVTSDAMTDADWQEVLDQFIEHHADIAPVAWKAWCEQRVKGKAVAAVKQVEKEQDISLDDFEPVSTSKPMDTATLIILARRARTQFGYVGPGNGRAFYGEKDGKLFWVDKRTLTTAELPVTVTNITDAEPEVLQALYDALSEEMKG